MNRAVPFLDNHQAQRKIELFRRSRLALLVVCVLCFGVPGCPAQQTRAVQASLTADTKAFQQLENRWSEAIGKRDQYGLELVLSPELVDVSATGDVTTRKQQIAMLFEKGGEPLSLDQRVLSVRILGDLAVVIGVYLLESFLRKWSIRFLDTSLFASITSFTYSAHHLRPAEEASILSVYVAGAAILAWRRHHLAGVWSSVFAATVTMILYLNVLVAIDPAFWHLGALKVLAPAHSMNPFMVMQLPIAVFFVVLGTRAVKRFHAKPTHPF
jgi:ketosteroid isomerase-like protein